MRLLKVTVAIIAFLMGCNMCANICYCSEISNIIDEIDFSDTKKTEEISNIDFEKLVKEITEGNVTKNKDILHMGINVIIGEIEAGKSGFVNVLILAIISAIFTNFAKSFKNETISETGIFVTLLAIMALLFSCFYLSESIARNAIEAAISFMKAAMPVFAMVMAVSGAGMSALVVNELILGLVTLIYWLLQVVVLNVASIYAAFSMINSLSKDKSLNKMCKLFNKAGSWIIKTVIGIVIGVGTIQSMILPMSDSLKTNVLTKALGAIPGIGNGVSAVSSTVIGSACLVKNSVGVASLIVIAAICIVPVLKLIIFVLLYKVLAAVLEPVCDNRITSCINDISNAIKLQLSAVAACAGLFMISIAIICQSTNMSYLAG